MQGIDDGQIAATMRALLARRLPQQSICPSDVARALSEDETHWRALMPQVRNVAADLARKDVVRVTQRGDVVDPGTVRGPVRLMRGRHFE
ncbi:hypothetical protein LMG31886_02070 [Xanthomonas hydrangeae]|uniref:DUF3253 domain-containing protein n=1 Tax=Xanthomonas hydrangeae TaxID=2775159 RepID=UPI00196233C6|nr:hypothetical protein LMG31884_02070 [Xanthomonas hydrangeae]CAD7712652.1 hypothetical protein LMG31884_02070 [Xanthomonas hydrangeae]CAD7717873.1 hypothetical protein LMG31887_02060 [Xanthomonas hydrangeae]CAD7717875.1 hypothetical protein LMG31887_02060 [Xanthomonas hydrangeae]CAD7720969.1 hypothetical protein LMG31886_02070 [Xanthomonas hydrangeae]